MPKSTFHNLPPGKRQRIVDAAVAEFSAQPYARATLDRIVEAAGISKGSMYQYFSGKADLYRWLLTEHMTERKMAAISAGAPPEGADIWTVLEYSFLAGFRFSVSEPQLTRLGVRFLRDHELEPELAAVSAHNAVVTDAWLTGLLQDAIARGDVRPDIDVSVVVGVLAQALGEGMLDQIARKLGVGLSELLEAPERVRLLSDGEILRLVRGVTGLFRDGVGVRS